MSKNNKIKVGVIGAGHLGRFHVEQYLALGATIDFICFFDTSNEVANNMSKDLMVVSYDYLNDLLDNCDAVSICTPTSIHAEIAKEAILRNCHVLIEKPITKNIKEAEELIVLADEKKKTIQVGHIERFNPAFCALNKKNITPQFIESHRLAPFNIRGTDVDVVLDLMIHDIDILLTLVNSDIKSINASGVSVLSDTIDMANTRIEFKNGCVANMTASRISQKKLRKFRIFEPFSYTNIDFLNPCVETYVLSNKKPEHDCSYIVMNQNEEKYILYDKPTIVSHNALKMELSNFVQSILQNEEPAVTGVDGLSALKIAMQIQSQIKNNNS